MLDCCVVRKIVSDPIYTFRYFLADQLCPYCSPCKQSESDAFSSLLFERIVLAPLRSRFRLNRLQVCREPIEVFPLAFND